MTLRVLESKQGLGLLYSSALLCSPPSILQPVFINKEALVSRRATARVVEIQVCC